MKFMQRVDEWWDKRGRGPTIEQANADLALEAQEIVRMADRAVAEQTYHKHMALYTLRAITDWSQGRVLKTLETDVQTRS